MKKLFVLLLVCTSCENSKPKEISKKEGIQYIGGRIEKVSVDSIIFRGHTYVHFSTTHAGWGAHSGDCPHPNHKINPCDSSLKTY